MRHLSPRGILRAAAALNKRTVGTTAVVALLSTAVVVAAVRADGAKATNVQLDDGSVWVSNQAAGRIGRLNVRVDELDLALVAGTTPDVVQEGRNVFFTGDDGGVKRIDVVSGQAAGKNGVNLADYQVNGGVAVLFDPPSGKLWVGRSAAIVGADFPKKADAQIEPGSKVVVTAASNDRLDKSGTPRGKVLVADSSGWYELELDGDYRPLRPLPPEPNATADTAVPTTTALASPAGTVADAPPEPIKAPVVSPLPIAIDETTTITAVGDRLVFLKPDGTVFSTDGKVARITGAAPKLQPPGPRSDTVLVSSGDGLYQVSIGSDAVTQLSKSTGIAAAPVRVGPCVYGAWSSEKPTWSKQCNGKVIVDAAEIRGAAANADLVFRVNQNNVALNAVGNGDLWADHDGTLAYVGNWADAEPDVPDDSEDNSPGKTTREAEKVCIEDGSEPPIAGDDQLGARPRQSIVDVLYNDDDPNCEPIAIARIVDQPSDGSQLTIIDNGQHLLFAPSQETQSAARTQAQSIVFSYVVADSSGHESNPATVTLVVRDVELGNGPPALRPKGGDKERAMRTVVEEGRAISYNVLADWWDPDGDDLRLVDATPQGRGEVSNTPDGVVRFAANGVSASVQNVDVTMSDGLLTATKPLEVTVKPSGSPIPPITSNDFVTLVEGASGTVFPLANDSDPNEDHLTLIPKWPIDSAGFRVKTVGEGALEITAVTQGTYALTYEASDDIDTTRGAIRLVVLKPDGSNHAPIAVPDQIKLRPDRVVNIDVLANDIDADGDLLAIADVPTPTDQSGAEVRASIVDRRMVQVEVVPGLDGLPPTGTYFVRYTVDDGRGAERAATQDSAQNTADAIRAEGLITISIVPPSSDQPPVLTNDSAVVRTGDIVAVPVLANDSDPDGDALVLKSVDLTQATDLETAGQGVAWISGRLLYFQGGTPGSHPLQYSVLANGKEATGEVSFTVRAAPDPASNPNGAPAPKSLVLRAVRNAEVRLPIPLFGVDPDGDSVTLASVSGLQGAADGNGVRIDPENPGIVLFKAAGSTRATDQFEYVVRDAFGETGTATVKVVMLDNKSWPPVAHDDVFRGKPGRTLTIPVLANDASPQDNPLSLDDKPFFVDGLQSDTPQHPDAVEVLDQSKPENRGRIAVRVPTDGSTLSELYQITDTKSQSKASVRVTPDPAAPNIPPVATLDTVKTEEIAGNNSVVVSVLKNDFDPDDDRALTVSIPVNQNATESQGVVTIPLTLRAQIVLYRLADGDGGSTIGIIRVPGSENHPPQLSSLGKDPNARKIEAGAAQPLTIRLSDIVEDPDKDPEIRLTPTEVLPLGGQGTIERLPGDAGFTYLPPANLQTSIQATIQFEVTDRPDRSEAERQLEGCNCLSTLSIVVTVQASSPPRVISQGNVQVPQFDEEVSYELSGLVVDDQADPLTYTLLGNKPGGLDVQLNGSKLTLVSHLAGDQAIPVGTPIPLKFTVTDRKFDPVANTVVITIIQTNKGAAAAASFPDQQAERSVSLALPNLIAPATNPFASTPLTLLSPTVDGGATITCTPTGDCHFTSDAVGTFRVSYTLKDAVNRTVPGSLTVVVKGKPRAPGVPAVESVGDHVVNLTWTAADIQGGVFKTYHVTAVEAGKTMQFAATGGQFTGLTNGTTYHFTVLAENELGMGDVSLQSSPAIPDRVPDPPVSPLVTGYGDGTLSLKWSPPATAGDFTPIQKYEISIGGQTLSTDGGTTTLTVSSALQNGTDYTFRVRAQNKATTNNGWGEWSVLSAPERPSRYPDPPSAPTVTSVGDGGTPRLTVQWNAPAFDGGRPITQYKVCRVQDAANCQTIASGLQATFALARNLPSSFTVIAYNSDIHKNDSVASAPSAVTTTVGNPDVPVISSVQSLDHALTVAANSTNGSGCSSVSLEYSINGAASWQASTTFTGLNNGTSYTVIAKAVLPSTCGTAGTTYQSAASAGVSQTPYGPLVQPSMTAVRNGNVITWTWNTNRADDNRPGWTATLSGECAGQALPSGSLARDFGYSSGPRSCALTVSAPGMTSLQASAGDATPPPPPSPSISITTGGTGANGNGTTPCGGCFWINVHLRNFAAFTQYFVSSDIGGAGNHNVTTDGSGSADVGDGYWYCGNPVKATASAGSVTSPQYVCQ